MAKHPGEHARTPNGLRSFSCMAVIDARSRHTNTQRHQHIPNCRLCRLSCTMKSCPSDRCCYTFLSLAHFANNPNMSARLPIAFHTTLGGEPNATTHMNSITSCHFRSVNPVTCSQTGSRYAGGRRRHVCSSRIYPRHYTL